MPRAASLAMTLGLVLQVAAVLLANIALHGASDPVGRHSPVVGSLMMALLLVTSVGSAVVWKRTVLDPLLRRAGEDAAAA